MVCLARSLGLAVTAEGVETANQLAFLERAGCSEGQGFLIGPPLDAAQARARLAGQTRPLRRSAA